jgi:hypothetical protein
MRYVLSADTDGGSVVLLDRGVLPDPLPSPVADSDATDEAFLKLVDDECVLWYGDSDGTFWMHAYVDEPIPARFEQFAEDPQLFSQFPVPTGTLQFVGIEDVFDEEGASASSFQVAPGKYSVRAFEVEYPRNFFRRELRKCVWLIPYLLRRVTSVLFLVALGSCCGIPLALFKSLEKPGALYFAGVFAVLLGLSVSLMFLADKVEQEFPSFVAHFSRIDE